MSDPPLDAIIHDEFERLYQQMLARKTAPIETYSSSAFLEKTQAHSATENSNIEGNNFVVASPSSPLAEPGDDTPDQSTASKQALLKEGKKKPKQKNPSLSSAPSVLAERMSAPKPRRQSSITDPSSKPSLPNAEISPPPKKERKPRMQKKDPPSAATSDRVEFTRAPSDPQLLWPDSVIEELKGEGLLTFRAHPSRPSFVFRGSLYQPDAFKGKHPALMKATIDLDGLWRYYLLQQSSPKDTSMMLVKRGLRPLFLRRCLQRDPASQKDRWVSPKCEAQKTPVEKCYVERPESELSKTKKTRSVKKTTSKASAADSIAKKKTEPAPSPSAAQVTPKAEPTPLVRPRPRSLLANALPSIPVEQVHRRASTGDSVPSSILSDFTKRPADTLTEGVVHHPQVKRTKKS